MYTTCFGPFFRSCVYCVIVLCVLLLRHVYCTVCITILDTSVAGLLARSQYPEGPATGHLAPHFLGSPLSVHKLTLRWFPRLQVATACFSCSPTDLNLFVTYFIFMYMHNNHCHRVTVQLQLVNYYIIVTQLGNPSYPLIGLAFSRTGCPLFRDEKRFLLSRI